MRWPVALPLFAAFVVGLAGCRGSRSDLVERELHAREEDVRTLKEEVERLGLTNEALAREVAAHRGEPGPDGRFHAPSEPYPMRSLVLGRQTGGRHAEASGGDDGLVVVVEPRDCDDQTIKAPGEMVIDVIETPREGPSRPLRRYTIAPDQLRRTWQSGLFSTGYRLSLDFDRWPTTDRLRIVAHFRTSNGRVFEAGKDVVVRLAPERERRPAAEVVPTPVPVPVPVPAPTPIPNNQPVIPQERPQLPPPTPVPEPPTKAEGPVLTRVQGGTPEGVEMYRPVPLVEE